VILMQFVVDPHHACWVADGDIEMLNVTSIPYDAEECSAWLCFLQTPAVFVDGACLYYCIINNSNVIIYVSALIFFESNRATYKYFHLNYYHAR
jgi:hypothetical protein